MSDPHVPFGTPVQEDPALAYRVGQLETENAWLRKRVRRYNRASWVLGVLLALLGVLQLIGDAAGPV